MISAIISQLKVQQLGGKPLFTQVSEAVDLGQAMKGKLLQSPVAYVIEISRRPSANQRDMGNALQQITTTIGVVIGIAKRNDPTGSKAAEQVSPVLSATRKALFGFVPTAEHSQLLLGAADTIGVNEHALWQLERFTSTHLEQAQ